MTDTEVTTRARDVEAPPSGTSTAEEAERILRQANPARVMLRWGAIVGVLVLVVGGGYAGYRAYEKNRARNPKTVAFAAGKATIGNDLWPNERPAHEVDLAAFAIDRYEVTTSAYSFCVEAGKCTVPLKGADCNYQKEDRGNHPINCVTWEQASAFCAWAEKRLPTEQEWERAARRQNPSNEAAVPRPYQGNYPWGEQPPTARLANVCGKECAAYYAERGKGAPMMHEFEDGFPSTAPVGSFPEGATSDGVEDMAGNVWEWTSSPYCEYPATECGNTVDYIIRGGGFMSYQPRNLEATTREAVAKKEATETVGFRCAK